MASVICRVLRHQIKLSFWQRINLKKTKKKKEGRKGKQQRHLHMLGNYLFNSITKRDNDQTRKLQQHNL